MSDPSVMAELSLRYASPETADSGDSRRPSSSSGVLSPTAVHSPVPPPSAAAAIAGPGLPPMPRLPIPGVKGRPVLSTRSLPVGGPGPPESGGGGGSQQLQQYTGRSGRSDFAPLRPNQMQVCASSRHLQRVLAVIACALQPSDTCAVCCWAGFACIGPVAVMVCPMQALGSPTLQVVMLLSTCRCWAT